MASGLRNKRKLENEEQSEREKEGKLEEEESEHEKETKPEYEEQSKPSSAAECSFKVQESGTTGSSVEEDDETDQSYTEGRLTDGEEGNFPASKWKYVDLKNMNVHYNKKPDPIKEFTQNVKADVLENYPNIPDFEKNVKRLSSLTKENVLISCEKLFTSYDLNTAGDEHKNYLEIELMKKIQNDLGRINTVDEDLDYRDLLKVWYVAARRFLYSTVSLIGRVIHPPKETVAVLKQKELMKSKKKRSKGKRHAGRSAERERPVESVYQHYFIKFAELFFLENTAVVKRSFVFGEKIVSSTPDLEYGFAPTPSTMPTKKENTLLFVVEAKGKPINNVSSECLEDQLDDGVLRRVGCELIAKIPFSVMFPNTLGIICMETKIIFVYLKVTKEDFELLTLPLKSQGIIHYTRSFDMLKAEDRGEICEFLYWLGCIQNRDLM
nr:uncharacterized protein LOC105325187 [Crassostrea gigas]